MNKKVLNIKTDPETKQQIQEFAAELGMPVSVILNAQIKQMLRDRKLMFSTELKPTPYLEKIMEEVERDLVAKRNIIWTNSNSEAIAHLDSL